MVKKSGIALICAGTVFMSGAFGFGGAYIANMINGESAGGTSSEIMGNSANVENTSTSSGSQSFSISEIYEKNSDSVVEISTETKQFDRMMGQYVSSGAGSGVIISGDGHIVTNNHVIDGASKITVRLKDGSELEAKLVGKDSRTDIAVLKVESKGLKSASFGDSESLAVGEQVVAIGNPLGELGGTVTEGIISALDREIVIDGESMTLLQTSAAVNPGNSGGGLFNSKGELVGIVNAKSSGSDIEGLGFAIPAKTAKEVVEQIISNGYVPGRPELGVSLLEILDENTAASYRVQELGVYVGEVSRQNGLQPGDRIISVDGKEIERASDIKEIIDAQSAGDKLKIVVSRDGQKVSVVSELVESMR